MNMGLNKETDLQLLERWQASEQAGDEQAGKQAGKLLVLRYHEDLTQFFHNTVGDERSKDLVRETFARLSKSYDAYRRNAGVRTHLFQIARRVLLQHLAKGSQDSPQTFDPLTHTVGDVSGTARSERMASVHDGTPLLDCLRTLPVDTMQLLELYHRHGCTPGELGKIFEESQAVILERLPEAMESLRRAVTRRLAEAGKVATIEDLEEALRELGMGFDPPPSPPQPEVDTTTLAPLRTDARTSDDPTVSMSAEFDPLPERAMQGSIVRKMHTRPSPLAYSEEKTVPTNPPLRLQLSTSVRLEAVIDGAGNLEIYYRGMALSTCNDALLISYPDQGPLPVTVEILDHVDASEQRWTVTAKHGAEWTRSNDRCSFAWTETITEARVDVTATNNGVSKPKPIFITVLPEGARPW